MEFLQTLSVQRTQYHIDGSDAILTGVLNICEPEEGRFNVTTQTFSDGDAGRLLKWLCFSSALFPCLQREEAVLQTLGLQVMHQVQTVWHW